jgi:transposase InsO family protein
MKVVHPGSSCEAVVATPANRTARGTRMNVHKNARLTPQGRLLMVRRIEEHGWTVAAAAGAAGLSVRRAYHWLGRYRTGGERMLHDRSSAPVRCRDPVPAARVAEIERLRRQRMSGPQIACRLAMPGSTVGLVLRRLGLGRLAALEPKPPVVRYERERPGDMIHLDIKKLGRIVRPSHRVTGDRRDSVAGAGWEHLHVAVDDASRLAYTEILPNERKESATAFLVRALCWFERHGVTVARVMTDNGSAYRSKLFRETCAAAEARHVTTRPYTPRTNGKAERFIRTALQMGLRPHLSELGTTA